MTVIYRDKTTNHRILIPIEEPMHTKIGGFVEPRWSIKCLEIFQSAGHGYMNCITSYMPLTVLERYYRKEEL